MLEERTLLLAALAAAAGRETSSGERSLSPVDAALAALCPIASPLLAERRGGSSPRLPVSEVEQSAVGSSFRAVLVLGEASEGCEGVWSETATWLGAESRRQLMLIDVESSLRLGLRMSRLVEGKKFVVTIGGIAETLFPETTCPDELRAVEASQQATAAVVSIVDICSKISAAAAENRSGQTVSSGVCSEVAFGTLLGQVIWLVGYCRERWMSSLDPSESCPLPSLLIVSTFWWKSNDSGAVARIVEWTSKGGTKESVPPDDPDLREAYFGIAGDKAKKPPQKGKSKDEVVSPIRGVIWMRRSALKVTAALSAESSMPLDENSPRESSNSAYLDVIAKERNTQAEANPTAVLRRLSKRSRGVTFLYIIGDTPSEGDESLGSELIARSNVAAVELATAITLDVCGVRMAGEIAVTDIPMVREPSVISVETGSITSASDAECEFNLVALQRVLDLVEDRRIGLTSEALLRLNHLALRNQLPSLQLFHAIEALESLKAAKMELFTPVLRLLSEQLHQVDEFIVMKEKAAGLANEIGSLTLKWAELCSLFMKRTQALPEDFTMLQLTVQINDLLCCIGDAIDDAHRRHSFNSSRLMDEALSFLDGSFALQIQDTIAMSVAAAESLCIESQTAYEQVAELLQLASYDRIPWITAYPVDYDASFSMLRESLRHLSEILKRPELGDDMLSLEKLPQLLERMKDDVWRKDGVLDTVRECCAVMNAIVLAYQESRKRVTRIPLDVQDNLDAFCTAAHRQLNDWDSRISNLFAGSTEMTMKSDFRSLLKLSNASQVRDTIKEYISSHEFTVKFDLAGHPPQRQVLNTVAVPMEVAVEISRNLGATVRDGQEFDSALKSIFEEFSTRGQTLPTLLTSEDIYAEFPADANFRSRHKLLAQAFVINEYGTIPLGCIRRLCTLFAKSVVELPRCIALQHFLNEVINDSKVLSALRIPRSQALLLFETIAWSCVDGDSKVVLSEFLCCLCYCVIEESLIPPDIEMIIRNGSQVNSSFRAPHLSSRHWGFVRLILLISSQQIFGTSEEGKMSIVASRLLSSGIGIVWRQMDWMVDAAVFPSKQEKLKMLEQFLLPSLELILISDEDGAPAERTLESDVASVEQEGGNMISKEEQLDETEAIPSPSHSSKYVINDTGEPFSLGADALWSCLADNL